MSNTFKQTHTKYFQVHQALVSNGHLPVLSGSATKLYLALMFEAQRRSRTALTYSNAELRELCGLSGNSIGTARLQLQGAGLIRSVRDRGGVYAFEVVFPDERQERATRYETDTASGRTYWELTEAERRTYFEFRLRDRQHIATFDGFKTCCPFHEDTNPSLSVRTATGMFLCYGCERSGGVRKFEMEFSNCDRATALQNVKQITGAADLRDFDAPCDEKPVIYTYADEYGEVLSETLRFPGKVFQQRRPVPGGYVYNVRGVRKVLYQLPELLSATHVIVCEGEKDVESVRALGLVTSAGRPVAVTTNPEGAGKWRTEFADYLVGKRVAVLADMDEKGLEHAETVCHSLGRECRLVTFTSDGVKDVSEYLQTHDAQSLRELIGCDWFTAGETDSSSSISQYEYIPA